MENYASSSFIDKEEILENYATSAFIDKDDDKDEYEEARDVIMRLLKFHLGVKKLPAAAFYETVLGKPLQVLVAEVNNLPPCIHQHSPGRRRRRRSTT